MKWKALSLNIFALAFHGFGFTFDAFPSIELNICVCFFSFLLFFFFCLLSLEIYPLKEDRQAGSNTRVFLSFIFNTIFTSIYSFLCFWCFGKGNVGKKMEHKWRSVYLKEGIRRKKYRNCRMSKDGLSNT